MKRNTLTTAVLAGLTGLAGMVSVSNAVNVNPDGLGQVLLYPYYTTRGGNDTLISVVNTTSRGKAVKIRFLEALNSREVLDFNIYMSPYDVWTAVATNIEWEGEERPGIRTFDTTCTVPYIFGNQGGNQPFLDFEFTGEKDDGGPQGLDRTASGYIEIIEMATMIEQPLSEPAEGSEGLVPWSAKHVDGVPRDCAFLESQWVLNATPPSIWGDQGDVFFGFEQPGTTGGLYGSASIVNVASGTMFSYDATAIDGFWQDSLATTHTRPDSLFPRVNSGSNATSFIFQGGNLITQTWPNIINSADWNDPSLDSLDVGNLLAVNAVLTYDTLMNDYVTDVTDPEEMGFARTEWVLTFPTKRFHVDSEFSPFLPNAGFAIPPFSRTWHVDPDDGFMPPCEQFSFDNQTDPVEENWPTLTGLWDREERPDFEEVIIPGTGPIVSPPPPGPPPPPGRPVFTICSEASVLRFAADDFAPDASEILGEPLRDGEFRSLGYSNIANTFNEGWVRLDLATRPAQDPIGGQRESLLADDNTGVLGLPVIGFGVTTFRNASVEGVDNFYGGTFRHRGSRQIFTGAGSP